MASSPKPPDVEEESNDPMFVIKNLDTGLQMRIDDFDRLANIATDEVQEHDPVHKKGGLMKGTKALKHWTTATAKKASATAKKAVSGIKDVAHELNVPHVLAKHKTGHSIEASPGKAGPSLLQSSAGISELLLRRSTTAESGPCTDSEIGRLSSSMASVAASDQSANSQASRQLAADSTAGPAALVLPGAAAMPAAAPMLTPTAFSAPIPSAFGPTAAAAGGTASSAVGTGGAAAAAAAGPGAAALGPSVPAAVRLVSHKRSAKHVEEVVLAQVLEGSCGVVWTVAFSRDGSFLATAGQDAVLRVWQLTASRDKEPRTNWVYSAPAAGAAQDCGSGTQDEGAEAAAAGQQQQQEQQQQEQQEGSQHKPWDGTEHQQQQSSQDAAESEQQQQQQQEQEQCSPDAASVQQQQPEPPPVEFGPYFTQQPVRQYSGHTEDILDVSWSGSGFLLSASLDKSVRLWHVSQPDCLREFWHTDFVTGVQFHPLDAQRFVSGSIDGKIRVWSITENTVLATAQLHQDMVTAVAFSLNGGRVLAGTMRGRCRFYELADRKLEYVAQVDVRNQRGQHASGKKVTGICAVPGQPHQFLITTNDSRLRLLEGYGQVLKFKGHKNMSTQNRANLSLDGSQVVCGSDDGWVYVWQLGAGPAGSGSGAGVGHGQGHQQQQQQRGAGGNSDRSRAAAAAAAAADQLQLLGGKNAVYQAFQALEPGAPVTAVAFAPPGACEGKHSVLASGGVGAGDEPLAVTEFSEGSSRDGGRPGFGGRLVQHLLVSAGFSGTIKVHELL